MKNKKEELPATEEQNIDVFRTKEVSVAEFMGSTDKNLILLSSPKLAKENLIALKKKHEKRAEELISIEKLSPAELKELNVIRGELREPRYLVQKIQTNNTSVFEAYKKTDKANLSELIEINKSLEDKVDEKIKAEDERKKQEKEEEKKAEEKRIQAIKDKIDAFESASYEIIQKMTFDDIESSKEKLSALEENDFDFEEYDISYDKAKDRVISALDTKVETLTKNENQRLDNIRLEQENAEAKRKADLQADRLNEIMPYVAFGVAVDLTKLSELTDENYTEILKGKKELFDTDVLAKQQIENDRLAKEEEEKEAVYEIRKKRLEEAGMKYSDEHDTFWTELVADLILLKDDIYDETTLEFEDTLVEVKKSIEGEQRKIEVRAEREKLFAEAGMPLGEGFDSLKFSDFTLTASDVYDTTQEEFDAVFKNAKEEFFNHRISFVTSLGYTYNPENKFFEMEGFHSFTSDFWDYHTDLFNEKLQEIQFHVVQRNKELAEADAEKLKAENKARVKKYAKDKQGLSDFVDGLEFNYPSPELENEDMVPVLQSIFPKVLNLKKEILELIKNF